MMDSSFYIIGIDEREKKETRNAVSEGLSSVEEVPSWDMPRNDDNRRVCVPAHGEKNDD